MQRMSRNNKENDNGWTMSRFLNDAPPNKFVWNWRNPKQYFVTEA